MKEFDPRKQFSKWLARWSSVFWFVYMILLAAILIIQPGSADAALYLGITVSVVMIVHVWAYTRNSIYDKAFRAGIKEIGKVRISWKTANQEDNSDEEITEEEGESNG